MADLSLKYLLYGEDRSASKAIKGVGAQASSTGSLVAGGLSKMGNMVGGEVGDMLNRVSAGFDNIGNSSKGMGAKLAVGGTAVMGLGLAMQTMASKDIAAQQQLKAAVDATGKGYAAFGEDVEKLIQKQVKFGNADDEVKTALRRLTQAYGDPKKALAEMSVVTDLAAAKHISLSDAAGVVAKAHGGAGRVFKEFGITVGTNKDKTKDYDGALTLLSDKLKGQATASMDTFGGKVKQVKTWIENQATAISEKYGPAVTVAGGAATVLGTIMQVLATRQLAAAMATDTATVAVARQSLGSKIAAAAQWLWNAALTANPIGLVIVAIALLVGAIYLIATKTTWFQTVWQYMTSSLAAAWQWMWNGVLAPIIRFVLNGFASIVDGIANMLRVLSNIPGFGWAKTAADKMAGAAAKARDLAQGIRDIPDRKDVTVTISTSTVGSLASTYASQVPKRHARGTSSFAGGLTWVGEEGPELMSLPRGSAINSNGNSMAMASGGSGGSSQPLVVQMMLDGRVLHQSLLALKRTNGGGLALG